MGKAFPDKFPITMLRALVCLTVAASAAAFAPGAGVLPSSTRARSSGLCLKDLFGKRPHNTGTDAAGDHKRGRNPQNQMFLAHMGNYK